MKARKFSGLKAGGLGVSALLLVLCMTAIQAGNLPLAAASPPAKAESCQTFPETGFQVCGRFLEYWKANGGLAQQGFPISNVFEELNAPPPAGDGKVHKVQYFQRARFEEHLENAAPYDVLLGLLGAEQYGVKYKTVEPDQDATYYPRSDCETFAETGYKICGRFLEYWKSNGGLTQQGFPISTVFLERNAPPPAGDGQIHRVQYFQRARFEEHLENQRPYDVLLGLLGAEQYQAKYAGGPPSTTPPPEVTMPPAPLPGGGPLSPAGCLPATDATNKTIVEACVSNATPSQRSNVTVYGRLVVNGQPANGAVMETTWNYKSTTSFCNGTAGNEGVASCTLNIGGASSGFTVVINVKFSYNGVNYNSSTSFTTK